MTLEALKNAIANLLVARREAHGNEVEQARINAKLDKLYNLKYTLLEQESQKKCVLFNRTWNIVQRSLTSALRNNADAPLIPFANVDRTFRGLEQRKSIMLKRTIKAKFDVELPETSEWLTNFHSLTFEVTAETED